MADVIPLRPGKSDGPHIVGRARCLDCGSEWEAVAPVGTCYLECPKCSTVRGVMRAPVGGDTGEGEWKCNCGCDVFKIIADRAGRFKGVLCMRCGSAQSF